MFIHYRSLGVAVKEENRGEADRVITFYTENFGRIEIVAKSIRKVSSKLRGATRLFCLSEVAFIEGKFQRILTEANIVKEWQEIRKEPRRLKIGYRINEAIEGLFKKEEKDEVVWELLLESLGLVNEEGSKLLPLVYYYFFWNLVSLLGYRPELDCCVNCRQRLSPDKLAFSISQGGLLCSLCQTVKKKAFKVDVTTIKIIRLILKRDKEVLFRLKIDRLDKENLKKLSSYFYHTVLKN